jgi:hypothetical protein
MKAVTLLPACLIATLLAPVPGRTASFSNINGVPIEFPAGVISFADEVVDFSPGLQANPGTGVIEPLPAYRNAANTLGAPDMDLTKSIACFSNPNDQNCGFVSLGAGGSLTVKFTDNLLRGSGSAALDLWIFDMGTPDAFFLDVSTDGVAWINVGTITGTLGVDLDGFGYGVDHTFAYVRLRDAPGGQPSGATLGADIDAIGAISTTTVVPLPASGWLLASALAGLVRHRRVRQFPAGGSDASPGR